MPFEFEPLALEGLVLVRPRVFADPRGTFLETFKQSDFEAAGMRDPFVQDNLSISSRGVLRGIHYQLPPHAQGKLVWVSRGSVFDVCVDLRRDSATFGLWHGIDLDADEPTMLYVPPGFGHGYAVTSEVAHFQYKCTREYHAGAEHGIRWNDPDLAIDWPLREVVVSERDAALPAFADAPAFEASAP